MNKRVCFLAFVIFISGCTLTEKTGKDYIETEIEQAKKMGVPKEDLPFAFHTEGNKGVLLIHGLTATPWEVKDMGIYLAQKNITVYAPLLEGHGDNPYELEKTTWRDWFKDVETTYDSLLREVDHVYVVGVSTGGNMALLLGAQKDFDGIVSLGAPIWLRDRRTEFAWLYKYWPRYRYIEREIEEEQEGHYYKLLPAQSVYELMKLIIHVRKNLGRVDEPILIIQSRDDGTVHPESANFIYEHIGSLNKTLVWKEGTPHVIFEKDKEKTFEEIYNFIMQD